MLNIPFLLDTGSSNLVIPSTPASSQPIDCSSADCQVCSPVNASNSWASNTTCVFGKPQCTENGGCYLGITYGGGGSVTTGQLYSDTVCIARDVCVTSIYGYSKDSFGGSGIIGFASDYNSCNPTCVPTPLDNLVAAGQTSNVFGICITPDHGGSLSLGEIDATKYTGTLQYAPMEVDRWYNIYIEEIFVGPYAIGAPVSAYRTTNDAIGSFVDSGTSIILFGPIIFQAFETVFKTNYGNLPGVDDFFNSGCSLNKSVDPTNFPSLTFQINGVNGTLNLQVPATSYLMKTLFYYCLGVQTTSGIGVVLGDLFMENYYVVFDRSNLQLGFAPVSSTCV